MPGMRLRRHLARWVVGLRCEHLAPAAVDRAKGGMSDNQDVKGAVLTLLQL